MCLSNGSGVSREVHAPFCEGLAGKFRWSTHHMKNMRISSDPYDLINEKIQVKLGAYDGPMLEKIFAKSFIRTDPSENLSMEEIIQQINSYIKVKDLNRLYKCLNDYIITNEGRLLDRKPIEMLKAIRQEIYYALIEQTKKEFVHSIKTSLSEENATIEVQERMIQAGIYRDKYQDILKEIKLDLRSSFEPNRLPDKRPNIDPDPDDDDEESNNICTL